MENVSKKKVINVLKAAKSKVNRGWCQGNSAVDSYSNEVDADSSEACCWCASGAIESILGNTEVEQEITSFAQTELANSIKPRNDMDGIDRIVDWNDSPNQRKDRVLAGFDRAIARLSNK